jgi:hypothetical protein
MLSGWASDRRTAKREGDSRADERKDRRTARRNEFQRETLLAVQDAAMRLARCTGAANHQDVMAFRKSGEWQKQHLGEPVNSDFRVAQAELTLLATRVGDDGTRNMVDAFQSTCVRALFSPSEAESKQCMTEMGERLTELHKRSGRQIRELDEESK